MTLRVGQTAAEVFSGDDVSLRVGQTAAEVFSNTDVPLRVGQTAAEAFRTGDVPLRTGQVVAEAFRTDTVALRTGQIAVEVFSRVEPEGGYPPGPCDPGPGTGLDRYIASVPQYTVQIECLELSHPDWAAPHRRVIQQDDWTVTIDVDGVPTEVLFSGWNQAGAWASEFPGADESARSGRTLSLDDPANELFALIESVIESTTPIVVRLWLFRSDVLDAPLLTERYEVQTAAPGRDSLELGCVSRDLSILIDPYIRHTRSNSPGLRGR